MLKQRKKRRALISFGLIDVSVKTNKLNVASSGTYFGLCVFGGGGGGARNVWTFSLLTRVVHNTGSGHVFAFFTSRENTANMAFLGEGGMGNVFLWCRKRDFCSQIYFHGEYAKTRLPVGRILHF